MQWTSGKRLKQSCMHVTSNFDNCRHINPQTLHESSFIECFNYRFGRNSSCYDCCSNTINWVTEMRSGFTPLLLKLRETLLRLALLLYIFSSVNVDPTISLSMCHVILNMKTPHIAYACRRVSKGIRCFSSRLFSPF